MNTKNPYISFMSLIEEIVKIPQGSTMDDMLAASLNHHLGSLGGTGSAMKSNTISHAIDIFMSGRQELAEQIIDVVEAHSSATYPPQIHLRRELMDDDNGVSSSEEFAVFIIRIMTFARVIDSMDTLNKNDILRTINEL